MMQDKFLIFPFFPTQISTQQKKRCRRNSWYFNFSIKIQENSWYFLSFQFTLQPNERRPDHVDSKKKQKAPRNSLESWRIFNNTFGAFSASLDLNSKNCPCFQPPPSSTEPSSTFRKQMETSMLLAIFWICSAGEDKHLVGLSATSRSDIFILVGSYFGPYSHPFPLQSTFFFDNDNLPSSCWLAHRPQMQGWKFNRAPATYSSIQRYYW